MRHNIVISTNRQDFGDNCNYIYKALINPKKNADILKEVNHETNISWLTIICGNSPL